MLKTALANIRAHVRGLAGTLLAIILGVGFVTGTLIFGETARAGYFEMFARTAKNADAVVSFPSPEDVARVRTLSTVEEVDARVMAPLPMLDRQGRLVTNFGQAGVAIPSDGPTRLRAFELTGRVPVAGAGEALLDHQTAAQQRVGLGDGIFVLDAQGGRRGYKVVGLMNFGIAATDFGESSVIGLPTREIVELTGVDRVEVVVLSARPGVTQPQLAASVRAVVSGENAGVQTGDELRERLAESAAGVGDSLTVIPLLFGFISLVVAVFVIYNTFAILLSQRIRETGLLRCAGATRRQVLGSILAESVIVGLVGSALGLLCGIGVARVLPLAFGSLTQGNLPAHDVVVSPSSLVTGLVTGVCTTVLAAVFPALRASRVSPMAALRTLPPALPGRRRLPRALLAFLVGGLGIAVAVMGWRRGEAEAGTFTIVGGGVLVFLSVLIASPLFLGGLTAAVAAPLRPFAGTPVRLAVANARRNPGRFAVTTASLMIGIGLMALFSVMIASINSTAGDRLAARFPVDYVVAGVGSGKAARADGSILGVVPAPLVEKLKARPEFTNVIETRIVLANVGENSVTLGALSNSDSGVLLSRGRRWTETVQPGDTVTVKLGDKEYPLTVTGLANGSIPAVELVDLRIPWQELQRIAGPGEDASVMVKVRSGISAVASRDILESYRADYPLVEISSMAEISEGLGIAVAALVGLFGGLLGMTVLIAIFGIANTLSLSVVERTRESATLRAVGLTRGQLRGTLLFEALLMGVVSSAVGGAFGVLLGQLLLLKSFSDSDFGVTITVPWSWLAILLGLAATASVLAAVLPARRASGASIVAAMSDT